MALNRVSFACGEEQVDRMARVALVTLEERKKSDAFNEQLLTARAVYKSLQLLQNVMKNYFRDSIRYGKRLFTQDDKEMTTRDRRPFRREASKRGASSSQLFFTVQLPLSKHCMKKYCMHKIT